MQCRCGGTFVRQQGVSKKYGKQYDFWGCDRFRQGCKQSLSAEEYAALESKGETQISELKAEKPKTKPGHVPYLPRQRTNKDSAIQIDYRRMTDEQEAVIAAALKPGVHYIRVNADAGTGKSSMLRQLAARTKRLKNEVTTGIVISFGAKPAKEIAGQLPFNWASATVHQCGNDAVAAKFGVDKMGSNDYKSRDILVARYGPAQEAEKQLLYGVVEKLVELCKAFVYTETTPADIILEQANKYNLDLGAAPQQAIEMAQEVLKIGSHQGGITKYGHDFDDMIYLAVRWNLPVAQYRYVCVDEAQDSSYARMRLAMMMVLAGGSLIIVGDKMQAIMAFTYADTMSMDTFGEMMGDHRIDYGLTVNWRCPWRVLNVARILCPTIKARPNAPEGAVHEISDEEFYRIASPGDLVLCRVNADLVKAAYELIKQGIGAVVLGRDIGANLQNIIIRLAKDKSGGFIPTIKFLAKLNAWYDAEIEVLAAKNLRNPERAFQKLDDDYACILALCGVEMDNESNLTGIGIPTIEGVLLKISRMFGEESDGNYNPKKVVTLATVHKIKGGQCARVFVLRAPENHPHPMAVAEWEIESEKCVLNVAATRCGDGTQNPGQALFFVQGMPAWYRNEGGAEEITPYEGPIR